MNITVRQKHLRGYHKRLFSSWVSHHKIALRNLCLFFGIPLIALVAVGFVPLSFGGLKEAAEKSLCKAGISSCSLRRVSLQAWLGLSIDDLAISANAGEYGVSAKIPRVRFAWRIAPLLFKWIVIRDVIVERPEISLTLLPGLAGQRTPLPSMDDLKSALPSLPFSLAVQNLSFRNATVVVVIKGRRIAFGEGMDARMRLGYKKELTFESGISGRTVTFGGLWTVTGVRASVRMEDRSFSLVRCRADFYGGTVTAAGSGRSGRIGFGAAGCPAVSRQSCSCVRRVLDWTRPM